MSFNQQQNIIMNQQKNIQLTQEKYDSLNNIEALTRINELNKLNTSVIYKDKVLKTKINEKEKYWNEYLRKNDSFIQVQSETPLKNLINVVDNLFKDKLLNNNNNIFSDNIKIDMNSQDYNNLVNNINPVFNLFNNQIKNKKLNINIDQNLEKNINYFKWENEELTINFNNLSDLALNSAQWIYENRELLKNATIILGIGISGELLYSLLRSRSSFVKAHGKSAVDSIVKWDPYQKLDESMKKKIIEVEELTKNKTNFNKTRGLLIAITLWVVTRTITQLLPLEKAISFKSEDSGLSEVKNLIFPIIPKNKYSKLLKISFFIINTIILGLFFYIFKFDYNIIIILLKILTLLWLISLTLYNLLSAFIIINSNRKNKDISIFKYYPNFIKTRLIYLMKIRHYKEINIFIWLYLNTALYSFILLLLVILIFSLI